MSGCANTGACAVWLLCYCGLTVNRLLLPFADSMMRQQVAFFALESSKPVSCGNVYRGPQLVRCKAGL